FHWQTPQPGRMATCTLARMRLIVRRIYRAFPELDRYSDEQCQRFVRATRRGWSRLFHWLLISLVSLVALGVTVAAFAYLSGLAERRVDRIIRSEAWADACLVLLCIPVASIPPLAGFIVR